MNFKIIDGIEKIVDEETASLAYCEISCSLNFRTCWEKRLAFSNLGNYSMVFPYEKEYEIKYKDKNIAEVLDMRVTEALEFFDINKK